ncbi:acyl-CoA reductase [Neobacillus cucumis]|uniref:acyl-CoA reductase n=1 Tax=Neobacillus cucumis TaxID=1740721 RepID=UPI002E1DC186|nr:acyl-CoA reductase [Neobacillus cucumis]MED4224470.1 acyl-CoA reductase [Neobacillus cucumis]
MDKHIEVKVYRVPNTVVIDQEGEERIQSEDTVFVIKYPILHREDIHRMAKEVQNNRENYLFTLSINEIVEKIDLAVQKWLDPDYPLRQLAEKVIPLMTGYDAEMVRLELKRYIRTFRKKELLRFLDEEFDQPAILDEFRPRKTGGMSRAYGPSTIFHVFSGNVPGVQIWSLVMGLLVKSAAIGKTSMSEPLFPVLFVQSLAEVDEKLADSVAILPWKGGTAELEEPAIQSSEAVIVYGSQETVEKVRSQVPAGKKFLSYGHKISFAMIGREALSPDQYFTTIHNLAKDISVYDQQSCLTPQSVYVEEGGAINPVQVAEMLAAELERYNLKHPRGKVSNEEAMAIHKFRNRYQLQAFDNDNISLYTSTGNTSWTVVFHDEAGFEGSPLNRSVHVYAVARLEDSLSSIKPFRSFLQSCGLALSPHRLFKMADLLGSIGVNRICSIGSMNHAKSGWHHDGGFNLIDLVKITDIERDVEQYMEHYDPDVE